MNRLFGAKKVKEPEAPVEPGPSMQECSDKLGTKVDSVQGTVDKINSDLMEIKKEMMTAKGLRKKTL